MNQTPNTTQDFRKALGSYLTGVTVVTTRGSDGAARGLTANSFTSVSLEPPLVSVCIAKSAASHKVFLDSGKFAVSVLAERQRAISGLFASKAIDKFEQAAWRDGPLANPLIDDAVAWFDCTTQTVVDAGDHSVLIGRVCAFGRSDATPLGYCRGGYVSAGLAETALTASNGRTNVGAILERDGAILLVESRNGVLNLPIGTRLGPRSDPGSLTAILGDLGLEATLGFLFAVYEDERPSTQSVWIFYRGTATGKVALNAHFYPLTNIPWQRIEDSAVQSMLRRYIKEQQDDAFGIYVGDAIEGEVRALTTGPGKGGDRGAVQ